MDQYPTPPDDRRPDPPLDAAASPEPPPKSPALRPLIALAALGTLTVWIVGKRVELADEASPRSARVTVAEAASAPSPTSGRWRVTHHVDPISDDRTTLVSIDADQSEPRSPPTLGIVCTEGSEPYVGVEWAKYLGDDEVVGDLKLKNVMVRFGHADPDRRQWIVAETGTTTLVPSPEKTLIGHLLDASQLALSLEPYRSGTLAVTFQTSGLAPLLAGASSECARIAAQNRNVQGASRG